MADSFSLLSLVKLLCHYVGMTFVCEGEINRFHSPVVLIRSDKHLKVIWALDENSPYAVHVE